MNEKDTLIAGYLEGRLTEEESARLLELAQSDPRLCAELARHFEMHGLLAVALEEGGNRGKRLGEISQALKEVDAEQFNQKVSARIQFARVRRVMLAVAAMLVLLGVSLVLFRGSDSEVVAEVQRSEMDSGVLVGQKLKRGDVVKVAKGLVEISLGERGRMVLEGPAELRFLGPMKSELLRGRVLTRVTPAGRGYEITTPTGRVIDLGTEFGVSVDPVNGKTETHVLEGEVRAVPEGESEGVLLKKDDALSFGKAGGVRMAAKRDTFYTSLPPLHLDVPPMIRWKMEKNESGIVPFQSAGFAEGPFELVPKAWGEGSLPEVVPGPRGDAMAFDGRGAYLESAFPGIGGSEPRTVSFWAKIPTDWTYREGFAMVSWGEFSPFGLGNVWQISVNPIPADGKVGSLRLGTHGSSVVGQSDLRDGKWHHLAVVLYEAANPDVGQHVMLYVDGEREEISRRTIGAVQTRVRDASHGIWVGRNVDNLFSGEEHPYGTFFRGALDEIRIQRAALSEREIHEQMEQ